jgi:hypothetical protein
MSFLKTLVNTTVAYLDDQTKKATPLPRLCSHCNRKILRANLYVGNETVDSLTVSKTLIISTSTMYLGGNTLNINAQGTMLLNNAQVGVSVAQATALSAAMSVVLGM